MDSKNSAGNGVGGFWEEDARYKEFSDVVSAVSDSFESTYYVNTVDNSFIVFENRGKLDSLKLNYRGEDFFAESYENSKAALHPDDFEMIMDFLDKDKLIAQVKKGKVFSPIYRVFIEGSLVFYQMRVIRSMSNPDVIIVLVENVDEEERKRRGNLRDKSLANYFISSFVSAYYVNLSDSSAQVITRSKELDEDYPLGKNFFDSLSEYIENSVHPDDRQNMYDASKPENIRMRLATQSEYSVIMRDVGYEKEKYYRFLSIKGEDDEHVAIGFIDVTEAISKENESKAVLENALKKAESANIAKTNFLFNMSHDIRTPMNAVMGFADVIEKNAGNPLKVTDAVQKLRTSGSHLLNILNSILELSRIETGNIEVNLRPIDILSARKSFEDVFMPLFESKGIRLDIEENIRNRYVRIDYKLMSRIIFNILSNSLKYTPSGGSVVYRIEQLEDTDAKSARYRFTISDTGIGMSAEYVKHAFERFSRERNSTVSGIEGTGLGLALVKQMVELMNGSISLESQKDKGTTVRFEISGEICGADEVEQNSAIDVQQGEIKASGRKILVVEDNYLNREITVELLEDEGFVTEEAEDGTVAIAKLKEHGPNYYDLILMDIQMPLMNGYTATRAIREMYPYDRIPIIALSANAFEEDRQKSLDAGMDEHISKPIKLRDLLKTMEKYI